MRLEKENNIVKVWQTGSKTPANYYDSTEELSKYRRHDLSIAMDFLYKNGETIDADKIKTYLGKILRVKNIPHVIPTGNYNVDIHLKYLKGYIQEYIDDYGLNLDPDFQRPHVWDMTKRVRFVEFILQDGKTNPIYLNHPGWNNGQDGEFVIVDGKQRLTALLMFLNDEFPVFTKLDPEKIGYYASEFDTVPNTITIVVNDLKTRLQVLTWYDEMNSGNVAHTNEELQFVRNLIEIEKQKIKNEELVKHATMTPEQIADPKSVFALNPETDNPLTFDDWVKTQKIITIKDSLYVIPNKYLNELTFEHYGNLFRLATEHADDFKNPVYVEIEDGVLVVD